MTAASTQGLMAIDVDAASAAWRAEATSADAWWRCDPMGVAHLRAQSVSQACATERLQVSMKLAEKQKLLSRADLSRADAEAAVKAAQDKLDALRRDASGFNECKVSNTPGSCDRFDGDLTGR